VATAAVRGGKSALAAAESLWGLPQPAPAHERGESKTRERCTAAKPDFYGEKKYGKGAIEQYKQKEKKAESLL
jgi:hypothetical protein